MRWDLPVTTWVVFAALAGLSVLTLTVVIFKLMQVNGWGHMQTMEHIDEAFAIWSIRSMSEWQLDVSYLKEIGVELPQYVWGLERG